MGCVELSPWLMVFPFGVCNKRVHCARGRFVAAAQTKRG